MAPLADKPSEIGFCDFTKVKRVEITLRGEPFPHLLAACGGAPKALRTIGRPWPRPARPRPGSALVRRHS